MDLQDSLGVFYKLSNSIKKLLDNGKENKNCG